MNIRLDSLLLCVSPSFYLFLSLLLPSLVPFTCSLARSLALSLSIINLFIYDRIHFTSVLMPVAFRNVVRKVFALRTKIRQSTNRAVVVTLCIIVNLHTSQSGPWKRFKNGGNITNCAYFLVHCGSIRHFKPIRRLTLRSMRQRFNVTNRTTNPKVHTLVLLRFTKMPTKQGFHKLVVMCVSCVSSSMYLVLCI